MEVEMAEKKHRRRRRKYEDDSETSDEEDESEDDDDENDDVDRQQQGRRRGGSRAGKNVMTRGFSALEIRRLIKSVKKFPRPTDRRVSVWRDSDVITQH